MELSFRPATPADTEAAVPLVYSSGPEEFDYVFTHPARGTAQDFLRHAFSDGAGEFGCRTHTVVEVDGVIVGVGACYSGKDTRRFTTAMGRQVLSFYGAWHLMDISRRGLQLGKVLQPPKGPVHYLGHLGVDPAWRGQGIGSGLIAHFLTEGEVLRRTTAVLDVSVHNPRAQALYERLGFEVTHERPSTLRNAYGAVAGHRRMEKAI